MPREFQFDVYLSSTAHTKTVKDIVYSDEYHWLMSCGNDKYFQWHSTTEGRRLGGYNTTAWCTCLQYPFIPIVARMACDLLPVEARFVPTGPAQWNYIYNAFSAVFEVALF